MALLLQVLQVHYNAKFYQTKYLATGAQKISGSEDVVSFIDVTNKTIEQVSKEVAEIIYFEKYVEADFQSILEAISKNGRDFYYD